MAHPQSIPQDVNVDFLKRFREVREQSMRLVSPLETEDFVVQPVADVSPPKWHLAHTTWFFEVFVLVPQVKGYRLFNENFPYLFNSYYVAAGDRWTRAARGHLTRPTVGEIMEYRVYVEKHMETFLRDGHLADDVAYVLEIGLQHEQQHQELLLYDIKYILGHNPLYPVYASLPAMIPREVKPAWLAVPKGNYMIGFKGEGFCFDNELGRHEVHLEAFEIADHMVTNGEYLQFIQDGGYDDHRHWLSEGWDWLSGLVTKSPMYWVRTDGQWMNYTLGGLKKLDMNEPVSHLSFYEADAYARWKGCRLPTEFEWEVAAGMYVPGVPQEGNFVEQEHFQPVAAEGYSFFGDLWEWTSSAYLPYPYYKAPDGALGEYNGKFMVNQKVLRGGSYATPCNHMRLTYRNFFHPHLQWLFSGVRLARHL